MADTSKPAATPLAAKSDAAAALPTVALAILRDYWPKGPRPTGLPDDAEYRVRAGETVALPVEEAMDVVEAGIGTRAKREDALKV